MAEWLDSVAGSGYTMAIFWTLGALLLLVVLLLAVKLFRSMTFGTFVAGGRNRKTRLAVMDATAVDSHRRLILVRRDDIEHLLLIGGPTDLVVERDIKLGQQRRVTAPGDAPREPATQQTPAVLPVLQPAPRPRPVEAPRPVAPRPVQAPAVERERPQPVPNPQRYADPLPPRTAPRPDPVVVPPVIVSPPPPPVRNEPRQLPAMPQAAPFTPNTRVAPPAEEFDDELLKELEVSLEETDDKTARRSQAPSLDDEMTKLLGELSTPRR